MAEVFYNKLIEIGFDRPFRNDHCDARINFSRDDEILELRERENRMTDAGERQGWTNG
jgi:hypothetical protein